MIMKKYKIFTNPIASAVLYFVLVSSTIGCKKETARVNEPPQIFGISYLTERENSLDAVNYGEWILIKGKNLLTTYKVDFNSVPAADSLIYADDTSITVKIPKSLPDPANNPITVTTEYGSVTFNFTILQPPPVLKSFVPIAGEEGDTITLTGNYLNGAESVKLNDMLCSVISSSKDEIKIILPAGKNFGYFTIITPSGNITSEDVFGFQYIVFDDAVASGWWSGPWGATVILSNEQIRRGAQALKYIASGGWGGAKYGKNGIDLDAIEFSGFKVSLYGASGSEGKKVKITINGVSDKGYEVVLKAGQWIDFQIPFTNLGNPTAINTVTLQAFSGDAFNFYIDDMGFY